MSPCRFAILAAILLVAVGGCGRRQPMGQVEGVLTRDGKPLHGVQVQFLPDPESGTTGPRSAGLTDENGRFTLQTDDGAPGAVVGVHVVCLIDAAARLSRPRGKDSPKSGLPVVSGPRFSADYSSAGRTPFQKITVTESNQVINFDVKSGKR